MRQGHPVAACVPLQVAAEALTEAHTSRKESEQLRETQTLLFGAVGVLGMGTLMAAALAVAARRSRGAALEAAAKQLTEARRRTTLDVESANKFGVGKFAKDVLEVADNLSRAAGSVPVEARASDEQPELKALYEGVVMTEAVLLKTFATHGTSSSSAHPSHRPRLTPLTHPPTHAPTHPRRSPRTHTPHSAPHTFRGHTRLPVPPAHIHPHPHPSLGGRSS